MILIYDKLIKELREYWNDGTEDIRNQAADAIKELQAINQRQLLEIAVLSKPKWIPVTERLPDNQDNVLCDDEGKVVVGYYTDEEVGWHDTHCYKIYPTHWMPLPQPPESEGE